MDERDEAASSDGTRWNTGTNGVQGPGLDALAGSWRPPAVGRAGVPVSADVEPDHVIRGRAVVRAPYADLLPQPPEAFPPPNGSQSTNRHVNGVRLPAQPQPDNRSAYDQPYYDRPRYDQPYTGEAYHQPPAAPPPPNYFTPMRDLE